VDKEIELSSDIVIISGTVILHCIAEFVSGAVNEYLLN